MAQKSMLAIEEASTDELVPYANNAKEHTDEQVRQIAHSIVEFGFNDPVAVWDGPNGTEIVEGHGRILAAKALGLTRVPVVRLNHLDDEQRRAYTHIHNQLTMNTDWNFDVLIADLERLDFDFSEFGFMEFSNEDELLEGFTDPDETPEVDTESSAKCKPGQVWQLGQHRLACGDSTDKSVWESLMRGEVADLMVTDPPYNVALGQESGHALRPSEAKQLHRRTDGKVIENDHFEDDSEFEDFLCSAYEAALDNLAEGGAFYIWYSSSMSKQFMNAAEKNNMTIRQTLIWNKNTFTLGRQDYQWKHEPCMYGWKDGAGHYFCDARNEPTVIDEAKPSRSEEHPTMKPVALISRLVKNSSKHGWLVIDPFGGSGTTLIACEQLGRRCNTVELDPHYCDVIIKRWEDFTGKKAVLVG